MTRKSLSRQNMVSQVKITKLWKGFESDHSSTNYSFYSSSKDLTKKDRAAVNSYSSRADTSKHSVEFTYHGDFADLPNSAQEELLAQYFDVMVKESYDWWELVLVLPFSSLLFGKMKEFECEGEEDLGITISKEENQIHLLIYCVLNYDEVYNLDFENIEQGNEKYWSPNVSINNPSPFSLLANLLIRLKIEIMDGNFTTLQGLAAFFDSEIFDKPAHCSELCKWFTSVLGYV